MHKIMFLKLTLFTIVTLGFISCHQDVKSNVQNEKNSQNDTIIVKHKNEINKSYEVGFYSKSYSYYWLVGKDTLDFILFATELKKDSTLGLSVEHKNPMLFTNVLTKINDCYKLIKEDFYLSKLNSLYFEDPIFYIDLDKDLSTEYQRKFGPKDFSYENFSQFILQSKLNKQLDNFLSPLGKKTKDYSIEKFHFIEKRDLGHELPNADTIGYPEFIINGMGLDVRLENK